MLFCRAYPVYTVGDSATLYPITNAAGQGQGQYYTATNSGTTTVTGTVGYTTGGQYVVQHTVEEPIITSQRVSPQTTNAVRVFFMYKY